MSPATRAATIWRFVYYAAPAGQEQIGLQNALLGFFGKDPVAWLQQSDFHLNSLLLMVVLLWSQIGFSMVLLSAAVKGVPVDTLEAARIDGAGERQIFFQVVVPQIKGTIITVFITVTIGVMKIFDIVYVMTNGGPGYDTTMLVTYAYDEGFGAARNFGYGATVGLVLARQAARSTGPRSCRRPGSRCAILSRMHDVSWWLFIVASIVLIVMSVVRSRSSRHRAGVRSPAAAAVLSVAMMRSRISDAALRVKVMARMLAGSTPAFSRLT